MKVFQIKSGFCFNDATGKFKTAEETKDKFAPDVLFVDAPDYVFEGWGYDYNAEGNARFIKPTPPDGYAYDDETGTFYLEEEYLQKALTDKLEEISIVCNRRIIEGFDINISGNDEHFTLMLEDQANINNLFELVKNGSTQIIYHSNNNPCQIYTPTQIVQLYLAAQNHITYNLIYHNYLKQYVQTIASTKDLKAITYGIDLPEPYKTDMQADLMTFNRQIEMTTQNILPTNTDTLNTLLGVSENE